MAIIVAGKIFTKASDRDDFLRQSKAAVSMARQTKGCLDFSVSADLIEKDRINIFELWSNLEDLKQFRGEGPSNDLSSLILNADVAQYELTP